MKDLTVDKIIPVFFSYDSKIFRAFPSAYFDYFTYFLIFDILLLKINSILILDFYIESS